MKQEEMEKAKLPKAAQTPYYKRARADKETGFKEDIDHDWFENDWKERLNKIIGGSK